MHKDQEGQAARPCEYNLQVQVGAIGASDAVAELLQTAGNSAVAAGATKPEIMEKALGYRVLPPHNPEATRAQDAYKCVTLQLLLV